MARIHLSSYNLKKERAVKVFVLLSRFKIAQSCGIKNDEFLFKF